MRRRYYLPTEQGVPRSEWLLRTSDGNSQDTFQRGREFGKEAEEWSGNSSEEQECGPRNTPT